VSVETKIPYPDIDTPAVLLDLDKLEANIKEMSRLSAEAGVKLRPHVKVHESAFIAQMQMDAGACGIEVGPIDQAIAMAEAGFDDIIIAHPFYGNHKLEKLKKLVQKPGMKITAVVDMLEQAEGISQVGQAVGVKIPVIIKLETGADRYGVSPGEPALNLTKKIRQLPGIEFIGVYAHEVYSGATPEGINESALEVLSLTADTARLLKKAGMKLEHVSVGSSATYRAVCRLIQSGKFSEVNEIHPGSCVIGSMLHVARFAMTIDQCTLTVLATVVSTSHEKHAVIDVGLKTLGADSLISFRDRPGFFWEGKPSFGGIRGRPDLWLGALHAEVSRVFYRDPKKKLSLGERLELIPNNPFIVINTQERLYGVRKGKIERVIPVTARGRGT